MSKRLEMIEAMIEKGSNEPFHYYARAMELRTLERLVEAREAFERVRERFSDYVPTYLMAAQVAQELGHISDARTWLTQGLVVARSAAESRAVSELEEMLDQLPSET